MNANVIFHSSLTAQISPVVSVYWQGQPEAIYRQVWEVAHWGNDPCDVCAKFIGWCLSQQEAMTFIHNLPGVPVEEIETEDELRTWYERVISAVVRWDPPALIADVDDHSVRQGELVRWAGPTSAADPDEVPGAGL